MFGLSLLLYTVAIGLDRSIAFPTAEISNTVEITDSSRLSELDISKNINNSDDLQEWSGGAELKAHNCLSEVTLEQGYKFLTENVSSNNDIIENCPEIRQLITVTRCSQLPPPITKDSSEQCFWHFENEKFGYKTSCETILGNRTFMFPCKAKGKIITKDLRVPVACACTVSYL